MSLSSFIVDLYNSLSVSDVHAEAPAEEKEPQPQEEEEEPKEEKEEAKEEPEKEEPEEEEEEEEEPEDPAPAILEECIKTKECKPFKHHYDECVERVTAAASDEAATGPKEDCVEEFFHVLHCANACVAPKLFAKLK